ncbi:MAG: phage portal protein [Oscillospiraceae bacterium]|nr:phage portal protein [Oscillospiraceae bacterium]
MPKEVSVIDRLIAYTSPNRALRRALSRTAINIVNSGYSQYGANTRKKLFKGRDSVTGSPKEDINDNLDTLRSRSKSLFMGGANIATGAVKTTRTNVIGSGLTLKPTIDHEFLKMTDDEADRWKQNVTREFEYYASSVNCDRFRANNFYELQQLAFISQLVSGDVFVLLPFRPRVGFLYDLRIQLVEADRVCTPLDKSGDSNISQGVETRHGEIVAYHISNRFPGSEDDTGVFRRISAFGSRTGRRNVLHLMESERPDQTRGVPILAPVIESLQMLGEYTRAELTAAVVSGIFTIFLKTEMPTVGLGQSMPLSEQIDADNDYTYEAGHGNIVQLGPGESIETASPGRPNVAFDPFVNSILRQIGSALGIAYEVVIMHFSASYSASRAALLETWKMFKMRRGWFARRFCQQVYEEWMTEAVAKGRVYAPGFFDDPIVKAAYCKAEWHGPAQGQIDPLREARAAQLRIDSEISTREREAAEITGTDYNVNHRQRIKETENQSELNKILEGGP